MPLLAGEDGSDHAAYVERQQRGEGAAAKGAEKSPAPQAGLSVKRIVRG
jgi:hypothetical protein